MRIFAKEIVLLHLIAILLMFPCIGVYAQQKKISVTQDRVVQKRIADLEDQLKSKSEQLNFLKAETTQALEKQEAQVQDLDYRVKDQNKEINTLKKQNATNSELSFKGAIFLLIGLVIGILGALILGAPALTSKIEELSDFEIDSSLDMALYAPKKDAVLGFYSMIGHIFLVIGFSAQFAGTAIVLNVSWISWGSIVFSLIFSICILLRILGVDSTQTPKQKLTILWKNSLRMARLKISVSFLRGRGCEMCLKKVRKGQSHIFWYDQGNSHDYPYLYPPSQFFVGHEECVNKKIAQEIETLANFEQRNKIQPHLKKMKGSDFISTKVDNYKKWFSAHYEHWSKIRADWPKLSRQEIALDLAIEKLQRIDS